MGSVGSNFGVESGHVQREDLQDGQPIEAQASPGRSAAQEAKVGFRAVGPPQATTHYTR